ncbi:hypothetical protein GTA62_17600 [Roseobacter sp. HKCCD9010]|uniref:hypothetical protein n=1 Tax=unclassified Roseobacter TaxID=196798 RepID=UPI0014929480|nr:MULTISPECIES: hypothetical protein [unclassified Roseobacter]MBF9051880.1 hypothetical protein [Rhodobacterales bacterium HKCCD4356]NNV13873.1 hypothetical protein [Roseobacter sp. HKCCD7357]NNV17898.1 hypothetical protein [Roseobacter sp. HKCCD8768]NNV27505.1 hypothetical protein [Roseobacter sp. HKCCD8192]NNV31625.1 hypothetical protein [Roseobacter sp. HKCCD9061]
MEIDEAIGLAVRALKESRSARYGYDYYGRAVAEYAAEQETRHGQEQANLTAEYTPLFEEAGWVLCLRGVLRPGVRSMHAQAAEPGGYSMTSAAGARLQAIDDANVLVYQSGSLLDTFSGFAERFGEAFVQRAAEAVRCRDAGVWLASCVMSGAAAEAVLLAIAIAKTGDEEAVLSMYRRANGRRDVLNTIAGQAPQHRKDALQAFTGIIAVWRDEAAHGAATEITTANADEALRQLLHMCQWTMREWDALVG